MERVKALFFDLDGTLLDGSRFDESAIRTCEEIVSSHPGLDAAELVEANSAVWQAYWSEIEDKWATGAIDDTFMSLEAWRRTLQACGCNDESIVQQALETHRHFGRETHRLFDDVRELFTSLKEDQVPLALITNGGSYTQRDKLRTLDIEHWFEVVIISGEVGVAKPDAAVFNLALKELAVEPENVWHVGDSLMNDVGGAKAAGLTAVWLNRNGLGTEEGDPLPDLEIRSLSNLMDETRDLSFR